MEDGAELTWSPFPSPFASKKLLVTASSLGVSFCTPPSTGETGESGPLSVTMLLLPVSLAGSISTAVFSDADVTSIRFVLADIKLAFPSFSCPACSIIGCCLSSIFGKTWILSSGRELTTGATGATRGDAISFSETRPPGVEGAREAGISSTFASASETVPPDDDLFPLQRVEETFSNARDTELFFWESADLQEGVTPRETQTRSSKTLRSLLNSSVIIKADPWPEGGAFLPFPPEADAPPLSKPEHCRIVSMYARACSSIP
mmetsp:Transcript_21709/g.63860  ORF Transcript_21709/g.63860 Transcript_21709/m.63860 type:complete len:262 (-) Transcript_21709:5630-6415(-)